MHLKYISKVNFLKRNSIPILLYRSIPLMCSLALLLLVSSLVVVDHNNNEVYAEEGIETYATTANPTATLQISNSSLKDIVYPGSTSYVSSQVNITAQDITDYTLVISGPTNLSGTTNITGAEGKPGSNLTDNTWGYAWADPDTDDKGLIYSSLSENGSTLASGKATSLDMSKKLTFAAKFAEDAESGHYKANVTLSLAATPREVATGFNGIYDMQDMTTSICKTAQKGLIGSLEDTRDGNIYTIAKLDDDNCWMTKSLALTKESIEAYGNSATLTNADSNVENDFIMPTSITKETIASTDFSGSDRYASQIYAASIDDTGWQPGYGAYYSFTAATAGSGDAEFTENGANASQDVCPKGWKLPTLSNYKMFLNTIGISDLETVDARVAKMQDSPYNFVLMGNVADGKLKDIGEYGDWWTSTLTSNMNATRLMIDVDNENLSDAVQTTGGLRYPGRAIRCIAKDDRTLSDISTMQDMTPQVCENTSIGATKTLTDSRDNSTYTVGKLSDGNCWMTENLKLDISQPNSLTPADSDVSNSWPTIAISTPMETVNGTWTTDNTAIFFAKHPVKIYNNGGSYQDIYGYYYTWCAATAGTCKDVSGNILSSGNAADSICPKGWKLPTSANYTALYGQWDTATWSTNGGVNGRWLGAADAAAGLVDNDGLNYGNAFGDYWSSTASSDSSAYHLHFIDSGVGPANDNDKYYGNPVRCIAY